MPKNYDQMIVSATKRIANYYQAKLLRNAGKYSVETYNRMQQDIKEMHDGAKDAEYYIGYKWGKIGVQVYKLDMVVWEKVGNPFFVAARQYIEHKQSKYGVYESDEQNVDMAIKKLYSKIGQEMQPVHADPKQKPIDYAQTIANTVEKIAKYYEAKLEKVQSKLSETKYQEMRVGIEKLRAGADVNNTDYFANFGWTNGGVLWHLDQEFWETVGNFFNAVKKYVEAKQQGLGSFVSDEEKKIMRQVKIINLKIGGGLFKGLKNIVLPDDYFMSRRSM